jgi:hypothetical protein
VSIEHGTIIKISIVDFVDKVLLKAQHLSVHDVAIDTMSESSASQTNEETMVDAQTKAEKVLPPKILTFLNESKMMPPPRELIFRGSAGRSFDVLSDSNPILFILIEGSMKLELKPSRRRKDGHSIAHQRTGSKPVQFKVSLAVLSLCLLRYCSLPVSDIHHQMHRQRMPLLSFGQGAIFSFSDDSFTVGQDPADFCVPPQSSSVYGTTTKLRRFDLPAESPHNFVPYQFTITFEKPSFYFAIPFKLIRSVAAGLSVASHTGAVHPHALV